jgi:hypothetical protein
MVRKPAYNTKAEQARRAEERRKLLSALSAFGDPLDELVPLLRAWLLLQNELSVYEDRFGEPYRRRWSRIADPSAALRSVRGHCEMSGTYGHAAEAANRLAAAWFGASSESARAAVTDIVWAAPDTDEDLEALRDLYEKRGPVFG